MRKSSMYFINRNASMLKSKMGCHSKLVAFFTMLLNNFHSKQSFRQKQRN